MNKGIKRVWGISEVGFFMMSSMETMFLLFFLTDVGAAADGDCRCDHGIHGDRRCSFCCTGGDRD